MKRRLSKIYFLLWVAGGITIVPPSLLAKVPSEVLPGDSKKKMSLNFEELSEAYLKSGHRRGVNGLKVGWIKPDFNLPAQKSLHVLPVKNLTGEELESIKTLADRIGEKTVELFKETELFSNVGFGPPNPDADYRAEMFIRNVQGKNCIWGIEVFNNKTNERLLSGFDKDSTAGRDFAYGIFIALADNPHPLDYFANNIPKKAMLFVARTNHPFDLEYLQKFKRRSPRGY